MGWGPNIFVSVDMERRRIYTGTCLQCETALCMDNETCLGCGMCVSACPFGYMNLDDFLRKATKCDLCGGNPKCVQMCMAKALHFGSINSLAERKRKQSDLRLGIRAMPADKDDGQ